MNNIQELEDLLCSMRNDIDISLLLIRMGKDELVCTPLEDLHFKSQQVIDGWCVVGH